MGDSVRRDVVSQIEENKALARRAWQAFDRCDIAAFEACVTPDWVEHDGDETSGLSEMRELVENQRVAFHDKHTEFLVELAEGELVAQLTLTTGTHTGRYVDIEPTGRVFRMYQINIHRVRTGLIAETWITLASTGGPYAQLTGAVSA
jgi:predicted ester cyclase